MARDESNDAVPSTGTRSNEVPVDERRPALRLGGLPGQHRMPTASTASGG